MSSGRPLLTYCSAFTLIELLVVISIISLLVSILMPALSAARDAARSIQCLGQLRQWGVGLSSYMVDNNNYFITSYQPTLGSGSIGKEYRWPQRMHQYIGLDTIHRCPAVVSFDETDADEYAPLHVTARFNDLPLMTYSMNALNHANISSVQHFTPPVNVVSYLGSQDAYKVVRGDDVRNTTAFWLTDGPNLMWSFQQRPSSAVLLPMLHQRSARHSKGNNVNMLCVDGSATSRTPEQMLPGTYPDQFNIQ